MALNKEVIFKNGVKIKYHRIGDVSLDNKMKKIKVSVISYTDETFRENEKENNQSQMRYEELMTSILTENQKEENERNVEQVKLWSDEANELVQKFADDLDLSVLKIDLEFENITDLSMKNLYSLIKENELFKNSENI